MVISKQPSEQKLPRLVKLDPTGKTPKIILIFITILGLFWLGLAIFNFVENVRRDTSFLPAFWLSLLIGVCYLAIPFLFRKRAQAWKRHEQCRQLAAQGNREQVTLAIAQPVPDAFGLPFSTILNAKNRLSTYLLIFGLLFVLIAFLILMVEIMLAAILSHTSTIYVSRATVIINAIILLTLLLLSGIGAVFARRQIVQQLEFTEVGLRKHAGKKVTFVPWDEARLFAIISATPAVKKTSGYPTTYELSSAKEVLRWSTSEIMPSFVGQTAVASDEYRRQMQALLSVIAARTGLPLYDLR
jgi:amino acid transporter